MVELLTAGFIAAITVIAIWELIWKGFGLWHSARSSHNGWFIVILIFNTAGILPIVYLLFFKDKKSNGKNKNKNTKTL